MTAVDKKLASLAWESLLRSQVDIMRRFEADNLMPELSLKEYDVLFTLRGAPNRALRLKELNEHVLLHQSALSRLVERLEARGLVTRERCPDDLRGTTIHITEHGLDVQGRMARIHIEQIASYVGGALEPEELETLRTLTGKLRSAQRSIPSYQPASS